MCVPWKNFVAKKVIQKLYYDYRVIPKMSICLISRKSIVFNQKYNTRFPQMISQDKNPGYNKTPNLQGLSAYVYEYSEMLLIIGYPDAIYSRFKKLIKIKLHYIRRK